MSKAKIVGYSKPIHKLSNKQGGLDAFYTNGANNLYPSYVRDAIDGSPTASRAYKLATDYVAGEFKEDDYIINSKKELYLSTLLEGCAADLVSQGGYFIHINIAWENNAFKPVEPSLIPYEFVRVNKEDDYGNSSKFCVDEEMAKNSSFSKKSEDRDWYYKYTKDQGKIKYQIDDWAKKKEIDIGTDEGLIKAVQSFPGQIRYVKHSLETPYTTSPVDAVLMDACSEYFMSAYTNGQTANGFMGKTIVFVIEDEDGEREEEVKLEDWLGTSGADGVYLQPIRNTDDPDKLIFIKTLPSQFDDKMFELTRKDLRRNILGAFDNLPESLVFSGDGALFGQHPDLFKQLRSFYRANTKKKRLFLYKTLMDTLDIELTLKPIWNEDEA